jgi:hypothetical protein
MRVFREFLFGHGTKYILKYLLHDLFSNKVVHIVTQPIFCALRLVRESYIVAAIIEVG